MPDHFRKYGYSPGRIRKSEHAIKCQIELLRRRHAQIGRDPHRRDTAWIERRRIMHVVVVGNSDVETRAEVAINAIGREGAKARAALREDGLKDAAMLNSKSAADGKRGRPARRPCESESRLQSMKGGIVVSDLSIALIGTLDDLIPETEV